MLCLYSTLNDACAAWRAHSATTWQPPQPPPSMRVVASTATPTLAQVPRISAPALLRALPGTRRALVAASTAAAQQGVMQQPAFTIIGGGRVGQALADMGSGSDVRRPVAGRAAC